jgi:ribosomal protein S18 acetylase RimI-like enzyme
MSHPLDNPVWSSLTTAQSGFASGSDRARRYSPDVAPFLAVDERDPDEDAAAALVEANERVYFAGVAPELSSRWDVKYASSVVQMVCDRPAEPSDETVGVTTLSEEHLDDVLGLTALVYPEFFRRRTPILGTYLGIFQDGRLASMAGERMRPQGYQEISAVCTHPDFTGRGYAARLITALSRAASSRGVTPFLHAGRHNVRALALYERLGFRERKDIGLWSVTKRG